MPKPSTVQRMFMRLADRGVPLSQAEDILGCRMSDVGIDEHQRWRLVALVALAEAYWAVAQNEPLAYLSLADAVRVAEWCRVVYEPPRATQEAIASRAAWIRGARMVREQVLQQGGQQ